MTRPLRIAVIAGEESGDLLGADLVRALRARSGRDVELIGVGGQHLAELGLRSIFDPSEIALMGITAVLRDLPKLALRIGQTARAVAAAKPDCLITIDSPAFNLRVSRKVRALDPAIPIVKYVCPSVWAWRPSRAPWMKPFIDHVLCLLPFEPAELERLDGPPGTYVGHRLTHEPGLREATWAQAEHRLAADGSRTLLLLPGSRRSEVKGLLADFGATAALLAARGMRLRLLLPTVPNVEALVEEGVAAWPLRPEILRGPDAKWRAFAEADAAMIASGTVSLELALAGVPMISCYRNDRIVRAIRHWITVWSAALPNIIADRPIVPEFYDDMVRPPLLARQMEALLQPGHPRDAQIEGFAEVRRRMATDRPPGEIAADAVLGLLDEKGRL